jgi:TonB family protein
VLREPISQRSLSQEQDAPSGHVLVTFDLDTNGRSENVVVVESDPPGLKDESVLRHVRRSRFRPQMVDGVVVPGQQLALQFNYRYSPDELPTSQQQEAPAE